MLPQGIRDGAERLMYVRVVGFSADDEQHVGLREPMPEAYAGDLLHLCVRRVTARVRGNDRVVAQPFGHPRICAAAEGGWQNRGHGVCDMDIALRLGAS